MKWKKLKLTDISKPKQWKNLPISELTSEGYAVYGANGIIGRYKEYNHEFPTLAITCRGATCGTINITEPKSYITSNAMALDDISEDVDQKFLYYALNKRGFKDVITGAAQPQITREGLSKIVIDIPESKEYQLHIANLLSKAENLIAQRKESIRLLDEFLKSTFLEMFGDPVRNEKGWEVYPFSELVADDCPLTYGIVQPGNEFPNGVPVIRPVDLTQTIITRQGLKLIDPKISEQFKRTVLKGGELLMCVRGTTGVVSIASSELAGCNVTRGITPIWFSENYNSLFAYGLFQTQAVKNRIQELTYGATLKQINLGDLRKIKLINPPIKLQTQFAQIVEKTEALKTQYQQSLKELENLYGSLSQKAFRGELSIKQAAV
jgi:type I restriction enzyme S subunit